MVEETQRSEFVGSREIAANEYEFEPSERSSSLGAGISWTGLIGIFLDFTFKFY